MFTQPDAAEKILQASNGPMHYRAITDQAIQEGLILCTEKNTQTIHGNVRAAIDADNRFFKLKPGVFDLVSRQVQSEKQEEVIAMSSFIVTENVDRNLEAMLVALEQASGILEVPMKKVRDVFCQRHNGSRVAQQIEATLRHHGLGHFPVSLNVQQHVPVFLYQIDSVAGRLVKATSQGAGTGDKYLQALNKIGEIVQNLNVNEQL